MYEKVLWSNFFCVFNFVQRLSYFQKKINFYIIKLIFCSQYLLPKVINASKRMYFIAVYIGYDNIDTLYSKVIRR